MKKKSKDNNVKRQGNIQHSLEQSIFFQAYRVSTAFSQSMLIDLRPAKINVARWRVLSILKSSGQSTVGVITGIIGYQQPIVSRTVSEMEAEGLLQRKQSDTDQRVVNVELSEAGNKLFDELFLLIHARREHALKGLSTSDKLQLMNSLKVIQKNLGIIN